MEAAALTLSIMLTTFYALFEQPALPRSPSSHRVGRISLLLLLIVCVYKTQCVLSLGFPILRTVVKHGRVDLYFLPNGRRPLGLGKLSAASLAVC